MPESGAERLERAFRDAGRPLFVPYVMGGYPDIEASRRHARILAKHADIIELGIPFSDPLADGPTIQAAGQAALDAGTRPMDVLAIADDLRDGPPVVAMTYYNTVIAQGADESAAEGVLRVGAGHVYVDPAGLIADGDGRAARQLADGLAGVGDAQRDRQIRREVVGVEGAEDFGFQLGQFDGHGGVPFRVAVG